MGKNRCVGTKDMFDEISSTTGMIDDDDEVDDDSRLSRN